MLKLKFCETLIVPIQCSNDSTSLLPNQQMPTSKPPNCIIYVRNTLAKNPIGLSPLLRGGVDSTLDCRAGGHGIESYTVLG